MSFTIERYGIVLRRLTAADIELVRRWRNDATVNQYMEYREYITAEMQKKWFHSINNDNNLFYVIEYKGEKIGLISTFAIDWNKRQAECGIFVWAKKYWQSVVPVYAVLAMLDINFLVLDFDKFNVESEKPITAYIIFAENKKTQKEPIKITQDLPNKTILEVEAEKIDITSNTSVIEAIEALENIKTSDTRER